MKNSIGQRILIVILAPSLLIFGLLSAFIAYASSQFVTVWSELEMKGMSETNAADLTGRVDSTRISVLSAASALDALDPLSESVRLQAENIIKAMFENPYVHNAWLACEPEAFDGRDSEHTSDYPGAPSGRFIRSYVILDGQIATAPDMDEETLDDPDESAWYVRPRDTDSLYVDASSDIPNLYDYGTGDDPVCTMAFAAPIHRDGKVIGCVGADMSFDITRFDTGRESQAAVAVFYTDGRVFFSHDSGFAKDSVDTLGFTATDEIKAAFSEGRSLFLTGQYSKFLGAEAFTYFQPVAVSDGDKLYLYTAMPHSAMLDGFRPILLLIAGIVAAALIFILFIIVHVKRKIANPLQALMLAADAVSRGDLETEIPSFPDSKDEIGILSRSLHRMVEQFRVYILRLEQTREEGLIYSKIDELMADADAPGAVESLLALLCDHLGIDRAMAVRLSDGSASVFSRHRYGDTTEFPQDFPHHARIMPMLAGKKLLLMNSYIISEQGADFLDAKTRFACILPLREGLRALGYVILESASEKNPFGARFESILCAVAEALSSFIKSDERRMEILEPESAEPQPEDDSSYPPQSVYAVEGLDSDAAIQTMGGMAGLYEQALKLLASMLPENMQKLDACIDLDMDTFVIEIHGLKGSLNNVGAYGLGGRASRIEQAAKSGDNSLCAELYAPFKEALTGFYNSLVRAFKMECGKMPGNVLELVGLLPGAEASAASGDCAAALELLGPMNEFSFDLESDATLGEIFSALESRESEKALRAIRKLREGLTNWEEA